MIVVNWITRKSELQFRFILTQKLGFYAYEYRESTARCSENRKRIIPEKLHGDYSRKWETNAICRRPESRTLNDDFYGEGVPEDDANPEHLF